MKKRTLRCSIQSPDRINVEYITLRNGKYFKTEWNRKPTIILDGHWIRVGEAGIGNQMKGQAVKMSWVIVYGVNVTGAHCALANGWKNTKSERSVRKKERAILVDSLPVSSRECALSVQVVGASCTYCWARGLADRYEGLTAGRGRVCNRTDEMGHHTEPANHTSRALIRVMLWSFLAHSIMTKSWSAGRSLTVRKELWYTCIEYRI